MVDGVFHLFCRTKILILCRHYKWGHVVMVAVGSGCQVIADTMEQSGGFDVAEYIKFADTTTPDYDTILARIRDRGRGNHYNNCQ